MAVAVVASAMFVGFVTEVAFASVVVRLSIMALICPNYCDWQSFRHFQQLDLTMELVSMPAYNNHHVHFH